MGTIRNAVNKAKQELEVFTNERDYWFLARANDCAREFNCQEVLIKKNVLIQLDNNGRWFFPKGFKQVLCIFGQQILNNENVTCAPIIYYDQPFLQSLGINVNSAASSWLNFQRNGAYLQFFGDFSVFQNLQISYFAYHTDEHGTMCVPDEFEEPIMYFLCMMWALKHNKDYTNLQYQEYKNFYYLYRRKIASESNQIRFKEMRPQIMSAMDTILHGNHGDPFNHNIY